MAKEIQAYYNGSSTIYAIIRRKVDGYVWNGTAFAVWANGSVGTYDIPLTSLGGDFYAADWPTAMAGGVDCRVIIYAQAGASPATSDVIIASTERYWNGTSAGTSSTITIDPYALTTLDNLKVYMRITGSDYDSQLTQAINAATSMIETATGRKFIARDLKERRDGIWQRQLLLWQFPVNSVTRIAYGRATCFTVKYTGTAIRAQASISSTGLVLQSIVAAGTATSTTLLFASYPTVSTLLAALPANWTSTTSIDRPTYELTQTGAEDALNRDVVFYYPDQDEMEYTVDAEWGRVQLVKLGNIWFQDGTGYGFPSTFPNYSPKHSARPMASQFQGLLIEYNAGYATVPAGVENVCQQIAQRLYNRGSRDPEMKAGGMGPFSVTFSDNTDANYIRNSLWQYIDARAYMA